MMQLRANSSRGTSTSARRPSPACTSAARSRHRAVAAQALLRPAAGVKPTWSQTTDDVLIQVPVAADVRGKDISFEVHPKRLSIKLKGQPLLEGSLADSGDVNPDSSFWTLESEGGSRYVAVTLSKKNMGYKSWDALLESDRVDTSVTHRVFLELKAGEEVLGRVALGLFGKVAPRTVENFRALCTGEKGVGQLGKPLHYKDCPVHRIIPGFMVQGGDFTSGDGRGGESIYGERFDDEDLRVKHDAPGLLAMANAGPNTNGSQFYILFERQPHLDGKHCVFGKVLAGMDVVGRLEGLGSPSGTPSTTVTISECGEMTGSDDDVEQQIVDFNAKVRLAAPKLA